MRQINFLEYGCPYCNADLHVHSVDFSHESINGESTKTTFQCIGCKEFFFTIEAAYVAPVDKAPEYKCPYCQAPCTYLSLKDDWTDYWKCTPCKTSYSQTYNPQHKGIDTVNMYATINNKLFVLRQFIHSETSRIDLLPGNEDDTIIIVNSFNFLFPNVTPANIQTKLLTYIVFS